MSFSQLLGLIPVIGMNEEMDAYSAFQFVGQLNAAKTEFVKCSSDDTQQQHKLYSK